MIILPEYRAMASATLRAMVLEIMRCSRIGVI